ncbi:metalloproteinase inhibitor 3-like [Ostrea edulis]|uniref:metalloproteinase inhibitor 3-like n=1 Tax=Ostrea edulis TaxID=37623 RepID=UPI0024AF7920|nr:metalloproteinase inhibitor 3-like [Ostrea edulis]
MKLLAGCCLLAIALFHYSDAGCSCPLQHPQQALCDDNAFVLKVKILNRKTLSGGPRSERRVYKVKVLRDYKNTFDPIHGNEKIYTSSSKEPCGVYFSRKVTYIISGYKSGGRFVTSSCFWNQKICTVTRFQKFALKTGLYKSNCQCKIKDCTDGFCNPPTREDCVIKSNRGCFLEKNACVQKSNYGSLHCGWKSNTCDSDSTFKVNKQVVYEPTETEVLNHKTFEQTVHRLFDPPAKPDHGPEYNHAAPGPYTTHVQKIVDHVGGNVGH